MYRYIWTIKLHDSQDEQEFIAHWREGSELLQEYEGALGTRIHRVRDQPRSFFLVAEWESRAARDAMDQDANYGDSERARRWQKLPKNESYGEIISFAGEEFGVVLPLR